MIAPGEDLPPRKGPDIAEIRLTFGKVLPPAVIPHKDKRILLPDDPVTVPAELFFMIPPYRIIKLSRGFQLRLKMQMKVTDSVEAHDFFADFLTSS